MQHKAIQYRFLESLFSAVRAEWTQAERALLQAAVQPLVAAVAVQRAAHAVLLAGLCPVAWCLCTDVDHHDSRGFGHDKDDCSHTHNCLNS